MWNRPHTTGCVVSVLEIPSIDTITGTVQGRYDEMVVSVAGMKEAFRAALAPREKQKGRISAEIVPRSYDNTVKQK